LAACVKETPFAASRIPGTGRIAICTGVFLALWGTALFFAVSHANLMAFLPLTFFGLVLALLYEATDNLLAPITTHALFNAVNLVMLLVETGNR